MSYHNETYGANELDESVSRSPAGRPPTPRGRWGDWRPGRVTKMVYVVVLVAIALVSLAAHMTSRLWFEREAAAEESVDAELVYLDQQQELNRANLNRRVTEGFAAVEEKQEADRVAAEEAARVEAERLEAERREAERLFAEAAAQTTTTTAPTPQPVAPAAQNPAAPAPAVGDGSVWDALAQCESNGNWAMNSGNGFYGGIQFMHSTWVNMGGRDFAEYPHEATREQQIEVAERLLAAYGWGQWPACSSKLGLR